MLINGQTYEATLSVEDIDLQCRPSAILREVAQQAGPVFLDSSAPSDRFGRFSLLTALPLEVITLRDGVLTNGAGQELAKADETIWPALANCFELVRATGTRPDSKCPYGPGWFGYLGYELGRCVEHLPGKAVRDTSFPDLRLAFYDAVLVYDAVDRKWQLFELKFAKPPDGAGSSARALRAIMSAARCAANEAVPSRTPIDALAAITASGAKCNFNTQQYLRAAARCIDYIAAGDVYQVNLSQRFKIADAPAPIDTYMALRSRNPAWYAAYMGFRSDHQDCAVVSCSPELFLRVRGSRVTTRPIKGTRPRAASDQADQAAAKELLASQKDNAELAMIIDLLRNDLGKVCRFGSVRVSDPRRLEVHPTVFHLVGTVVGELAEGVGPAELLRATFPGGSITGAPKIRAMEIIDELEPVARGVYTGCVGYVGVNDCAEWNIAIRTMVCQNDTAYIQAGGGIVADSTPQSEYNETLDKARAMLEAVVAARHLTQPGRETHRQQAIT